MWANLLALCARSRHPFLNSFNFVTTIPRNSMVNWQFPRSGSDCFGWSTLGPVWFSWLLNHVIYFKLRNKILFLYSVKIHKMTTVVTQNGPGWKKIILCICPACDNGNFLNLRQITWFNSQLKQTRPNVDQLGLN